MSASELKLPPLLALFSLFLAFFSSLDVTHGLRAASFQAVALSALSLLLGIHLDAIASAITSQSSSSIRSCQSCVLLAGTASDTLQAAGSAISNAFHDLFSGASPAPAPGPSDVSVITGSPSPSGECGTPQSTGGEMLQPNLRDSHKKQYPGRLPDRSGSCMHTSPLTSS